METAMRNVSINDRTTPSMSPLIKAEPSSQQHQDQPLDFSTKVRSHAVETDDSALRKVSNDSAIDVSEDNHIPQRNGSNGPVVPGNIEDTGRPSLSQPRMSLQMPNIHTFLPQTSMAGMGMFYPGAPVFPNFLPPGFPPAPMWPNPMAAMMQHQQEAARKLISQAANSKQGSNGSAIRSPFNGKPLLATKQDMIGNPTAARPFHTSAPPVFPNSHLQAPNIPDPGILAEALKSHEEMFTAYRQQVLNQKANDDAKRNSRRQLSATVTNGNHSSQNGSSSTVSIPESTSLSQINEDQTMISAKESYSMSETSSRSPEENITDLEAGKAASISSDEDKHSGSSGGSVEGDQPAAPLNGISGQSNTDYSMGPSLHSSDESLQTSDGRRSLTPAHSSNGELNDITGMRPRSMTLPTQTHDNRLMSYSPSPSVLSTGNSSGPGTPNSRIDRGFRKRARTLPDDQKVKKRDDAYWERRRKNNEAAKRSRDSRRAKEDEIAIRAAFLEQENIRLRLELASLKTQTAKLRSELIIFQGPEDHGGEGS